MASVFKRKGQGAWIIKYFDHQGRRREKSSRTTDKRAALRMAAKLDAQAALRREGVIDPRLDCLAEADGKPLKQHIEDYLRFLRAGDRSPLTVRDAKAHLDRIVKETGAARLSDLTLDRVVRALEGVRALGRSARTVNAFGGGVRAFTRWCVRTNRLPEDPLRDLPRANVDRDRRRERRALTEKELTALFKVADEAGRGLWYRMAYWAGLRRSELASLTWGDVDLEGGVIVVSRGKAKRTDEVPIAPELSEALEATGRGLPAAPVFPTSPSNETRQGDYDAAGMKQKDENGYFLDLHCLRYTLATNLARAGVPPQVAQRILRHSTIHTTLRFYTRLTRDDDTEAMKRLARAAVSPRSTDQPQEARSS